MTESIKFKKLREDAVLPTKGTQFSSGFDLTIVEAGKQFGNVILYKTGIAAEPPFGYYFESFPRSSISKTGYMMANSVGIIDEDYRGEIMVPLVKLDLNAPDILADGPVRVAQLILKKNYEFPVEEATELSESVRGAGGFGSTGAK